MTTWHEFYQENGYGPEWPYSIKFGEEQNLERFFGHNLTPLVQGR